MLKGNKKGFFRFLSILGPGLITGAADDDPSGIATYSQTGAQFGYGMLWTAIFMLPFLIGVQEACARIGAVKGKGLTAVIKEHFSKKILFPIVLLILVANTINIGADLAAMGEAAQLIIPINRYIFSIFFSISILFANICFPYKQYSKFLKWLVIFLFSYPLTVIIVTQPWLKLLKASFIPHMEFNFQFLFIITGVLGTTITPYLFFWQPSQIVEERQANHHGITKGDRHFIKKLIQTVRLDNFVGMLFSEIGTWSIIVVAATVLHSHGITDIKTAAEAAKALEPLVHTFPYSGFLAKFIFGIGIIGLGLLAVPVLAGSISYAICEVYDFRKGANQKFKTAPVFYGVFIFATLIGLSLNFLGISPFKTLVYSAVVNGIVAVPLLLIITIIARSQKIMGNYQSGFLSTFITFITFICMMITVVALFISFKLH